ncbi:MAG: efflux RND transporter permease subunit [Chitinophagales bacterium]
MKHAKEFKPTSWAINNRTSIFILTIIIAALGISTYIALPKEQFPDIVIPNIVVSTLYPGTSPTDMENLITRHIEKEIKSVSGVKRITSNSVQDFSSIIVEFNSGVTVTDAKQKVKNAVDKAKRDLPTDLSTYGDPQVDDIDFSEIPMLNINLSGDYELEKLKKYADDLKDRIEDLAAVSKVEIVGSPEREIQVDADMYKMGIAKISMGDINNAIAQENLIISGGEIPMNNMKRGIKVSGEFSNASEIENLIVQNANGESIYLKDIATVTDGFKEKDSYARLEGKNVISVNVIKRAGQNLIATSDKVRDIVVDMQKHRFPSQLKISITNDLSTQTRSTLTDLLNTIIIGFILVTLVLMFFMGTTNAIFVGLSVPLSVFIAFMFLPTIGFTLNMMVMFALLFSLGIVVDDAIVVIENTWRIFTKTGLPIKTAAKYAAGEVFIPVLAGTLTTLSPFFPLIFWPGIIGQFMHYLPVTIIIILFASLLVAYLLNPVFAVAFMKHKPVSGSENGVRKKSNRGLFITIGIFLFFAVIFYAAGSTGMGNFTIFLLLLVLLNKYVLSGMIAGFQKNMIPKLQRGYERVLTWSLAKGHFRLFGKRRSVMRPWLMLSGTVVLFIMTIVLIFVASPPFELFPSGDPNSIMVYVKTPVGTDVKVTDSVTRIVENKVFEVVGRDNPIVDAVLSNVAIGASEDQFGGGNATPNRGKVTVAFKEYKFRNGQSTRTYMDNIRKAVKAMPGVEVSVAQEQNGPPTGKDINIEIAGEDYAQLTATTANVKHYLDSLQIAGIENLKSDADLSNPEIRINVDRERAQREGISTWQVGNEIRTAVYGREVSKFRELEDEFPIMLRYSPEQRKDIDGLMNLKITFRNSSGQLKQIPLSAVATVSYDNTLGGVIRKNLKREITLSSNLLSGYTAPTVNGSITTALANYPTPDGITISQTGASEDMEETISFLGTSLIISVCLIFLILVTQFNSFSKPLIILSEILFSIIGVFLGFIIFRMTLSAIMTGFGIVGLAGIVVRNGILLVEFTDELKARGLKTRDAIIQAGKIRMIPVLLTATATMLGLVPLAVGFNINFVTLFTELNPQIYFGGDSVVFWGPLSWTIIFGLSFSTFLTLILVPCMYLLSYGMKVRMRRRGLLPKLKKAEEEIEVDENFDFETNGKTSPAVLEESYA